MDESMLSEVPAFNRHVSLFDACIAQAVKGGLYLEFGVCDGYSFRRLRNLVPPEITLYGFDSFLGLPEPWNGHEAGHFKTDHRFQLDNCVIIEGWFADTLPPFKAVHPEHVSFMNVDCDCYTSAHDVLFGLADRIVPGTVIHFDEFINYPDWRLHEYKAFMEFVSMQDCGFDYIGKKSREHVAVRIK